MTFSDRVYSEEKRCILRRKKMTRMLNEKRGGLMFLLFLIASSADTDTVLRNADRAFE